MLKYDKPHIQRKMDLTSKKTIQNLLKKYRTYPVKRLGQNFLIKKSIPKKIITSANLSSQDIVLEIGPGIATLTLELAKGAKKVIAVEKAKKMVEILKETLKDFKNVQLVQEDILKVNIQNLISKSKYKVSQYKVVANLPYYLTSPVIRKFLELENPPKLMILVVQKEVGERICAQPPRMNLLAVSVQFYGVPEIVSYVSKESFYPKPKVDSAILRIAPLINADKKLINTDLFFKIVNVIGFFIQKDNGQISIFFFFASFSIFF
jgi:16S rRNA (adenine1518-N6/adenine1519-N6)-dimethyltransferase